MEHKSERMMQVALANDWKAQVKPIIPESNLYDEIIWDLYCVRGQETLHVRFMGNRQEESTYTYFNKVTHPAHKAAAMKVITGKPSLKNSIKIFEDIEQILETRQVPFKPDSPAIEILLAVLGKEVTWIRRIDGMTMSATVEHHTNLGKRYFRVFEAVTGRRILEWQDREGFHAAALEQIIEVA